MPDLHLRGLIVREIRGHKPDVVITHDPFRPYAFHPDHRAVGFSAHDAAYPSARDPHAFPEQLAEGLEAHKAGEVWYFNSEFPDLIVDISIDDGSQDGVAQGAFHASWRERRRV